MSSKHETDPTAATISVSNLEAGGDSPHPGAQATPRSPPSDPSLARSTSTDEPVLLAHRYELLGMLGAGAMGTVYRARDRELDEIVALKVLKKELATTEMIERFRREVKLARRVTHRNVARTFDIGEDGGDRFLTMEFVEGEMLGALLARRGRLSLEEAVRLALDVCAGLAAAHAADVLHRDLKPENVIVAADGRAVITDFGIARAVREGELNRTMGGIVGTPAYMAPEQVEGASDLDARADLYALGTMLFELLTGTMAWKGDSVVTIAAGRLLQPPPDPRSVLPRLPDAAAELVLKLMARRREDRFSSAEQTATALSALLAPTSSPQLPASSPSLTPSAASGPSLTSSTNPPAGQPRSGTMPLVAKVAKPRAAPGARVIAVLPVLNLGASDDTYLVETVLEDIIDPLSVVRGLMVRPRGDTFRFTDPNRDVREIGRTLGCDVVVDGSMRRIGDKVRASFRLIAVEDGFQLWAKRFDRAPSDVLSIADDAAHAIAAALTTELAPAPKRATVTDPEAEELYLRGRYLTRRGWFGFLQEANQLLSQAHDRAPDDPRILGNYAFALARTYGLEFQGREVAERARTMALRTLELNPTQPEAKVALAIVHLQNGEADSAVQYLREALAMAPNSTEALDQLGRILSEVGRVDDAIALLERACAIDPEFMAPRQQIARLHGMFYGYERMMQTLGPPPSHPGDLATWFLTQSRWALWHRDLEKAAELRKMLETANVPPAIRFPIAATLDVLQGDASRLHDAQLLDKILPIDASRPPRRACFYAQIRAELFLTVNESARALDVLKIADTHGLFDVLFFERCALLDGIRMDPELHKLEHRVRMRAQRILAAVDARSSFAI